VSDVYRNYLMDLGFLLRERALEAKDRRDHMRDTSSGPFQQGRAMAYYEVVSLMLNQCVAFGLDPSDLRLEGLEPDRDLL
jgi:hypothetical protein